MWGHYIWPCWRKRGDREKQKGEIVASAFNGGNKRHLNVAHFQSCNRSTTKLSVKFLLELSELSESHTGPQLQSKPPLVSVFLCMTDRHKIYCPFRIRRGKKGGGYIEVAVLTVVRKDCWTSSLTHTKTTLTIATSLFHFCQITFDKRMWSIFHSPCTLDRNLRFCLNRPALEHL